MNASTEKTDFKNDLSRKLGDTHDLLVKSSKIAGIVGAICGFIYLLSYTTHVGIPFPLELSVLPTTLLIVGLTSLIGTFIIVAGMFIPALTLDYIDEVTKGYRKADDLQENVVKARFIRYFFCTWVPTALALVGFILLIGITGGAAELKIAGGVTLFISLGWIFYTPKYVESFLGNRWQYLSINFLQIMFSVFAYSLIIVILIAIFPDIDEWPAWGGCSIALVIFTIFQTIIYVPPTKSKSRKILLPPNFKDEATPAMVAAFGLAAVWTIMTVAMPQVNYKIGGAALRAFHVGGSVPVAICLKTKPAAAISQRIIFDADYCSEKLSMKLDSGDRIYVSKFIPEKGFEQQKNVSESDTVYFRQDEVKQKIYFRLKEVRKN